MPGKIRADRTADPGGVTDATPSAAEDAALQEGAAAPAGVACQLRSTVRAAVAATAAMTAVAVAVGLAVWLQAPATADRLVTSGPVYDLTAQLDDPDAAGRWLLTTVEGASLTRWEALWQRAGAGDDRSGRLVRASRPPAANPRLSAVLAMDAAQQIAPALAQTAAGSDERIPVVLQVTRLDAGSDAAAAGIQAGDRIVAFDGHPAGRQATRTGGLQLPALPDGVTITTGRQLHLDARSDVAVTLQTGRQPTRTVTLPSDQTVFDVAWVPQSGPSFTFDGVSGGSGTLMMAAALLDASDPTVDLTGGILTAGTGVVSLDGTVGTVVGVPEKLAAAEEAGARRFIYPAGSDVDADTLADRHPHVELLPVASFDELVAALCRPDSGHQVCTRR